MTKSVSWIIAALAIVVYVCTTLFVMAVGMAWQSVFYQTVGLILGVLFMMGVVVYVEFYWPETRLP